MQKPLLINCDMGEWDAPHIECIDKQIMPYINLSNVACGGHAGTKQIIQSTIKIADTHKVKVGAHPGYIDRKGFGRTYIPMEGKNLYDLLYQQIDSFVEICNALHITPFHIKPHGALYHACNHNQREAEVLIDIIHDKYPDLVLIVFPNSLLSTKATTANITTLSESFIDRKYDDTLNLVPRNKKNAVLTNPQEALLQYKNLTLGKISSDSNALHTLPSDTTCIHGDNSAILKILPLIHAYREI